MSKSSKAIAQRNKHTPAKGADDRIMAGSPKNAAPQSPATLERRSWNSWSGTSSRPI
jgi:hypothetical protein